MLENRPTKKQRELLSFIDGFIKGNGYGPSYREIMRALDYKSVSTVAVHVDGLIQRGQLRKTDNSARSLEVVGVGRSFSSAADAPHLAWLEQEIRKREAQKTTIATNEIELLKATLALFINR
jgi:repressor LexA